MLMKIIRSITFIFTSNNVVDNYSLHPNSEDRDSDDEIVFVASVYDYPFYIRVLTWSRDVQP